MNILGINAYHGNASAAIVCDGQLVAAAEEERFNRVKYAAGFPANAIRYCLREAGVTISEVDHIAVPRNPWARLGTKALYAIRLPRFALGRSRAMARFAWILDELAEACDVDPSRIRSNVHRVEHHRAHRPVRERNPILSRTRLFHPPPKRTRDDLARVGSDARAWSALFFLYRRAAGRSATGWRPHRAAASGYRRDAPGAA